MIWLRRLGRRAGTAAVFLCLFGCAVGPNYRGVPQQTTADLPSRYKNRSTGNSLWKLAIPNEAALGGRWWLIFDDRTLNRLESGALADNQDLRTAVNRIDQAQAQVRLATADRLSGASGFETAHLGDIFAGQSLIWSVGPSITVPIFEGGRNSANLQNARAQYEETVNRYRAQVLTAFQDVENALVDLHTLAGQASAQDVAVTAARRALELSQQQYEKGAVSFLDVLDAERTLLQDERIAAQLLGDRMQVTVQLVKALGGKWGS